MVKSQVNICPKEEWLNSLWWGFQCRVPLGEHVPAVYARALCPWANLLLTFFSIKKKIQIKVPNRVKYFEHLFCAFLFSGYQKVMPPILVQLFCSPLLHVGWDACGAIWSESQFSNSHQNPLGCCCCLVVGFFFITENLIKSIWPSSQKK